MSLESDVETIYQAFPRHKDKRYALLSIERALRRLCGGESGRKLTHNEAVDFLLSKTTEFSRSPAGNRGHFTPYPASWMNKGAYLDDPAEWDLITPQEQSILKQAIAANIGVWRPM